VTDDTLTRVETVCAELTDAGEPITFAAVAERARVGRATLYRRPELRAVVEDARARSREAHTLSGLASELGHLRAALEAVAAKVHRHEQLLRDLSSDHQP
jgi:hypothetical protein